MLAFKASSPAFTLEGHTELDASGQEVTPVHLLSVGAILLPRHSPTNPTLTLGAPPPILMPLPCWDSLGFWQSQALEEPLANSTRRN